MKKPKILCLINGREHLISKLFENNKFDFIIDNTWDINIIEKYEPNLILSIGEANYKVYQLFLKAKELQIPTLNIQDGLTEFRDIWENPYYCFGGNYFNRQFMIADKIACHGYQQAALFSSWGMGKQVEIVGAPWFEKYKNFTRINNNESYVLIMTANKPAFTKDQYGKVKQSLIDLNEVIQKSSWKPIWRCRGEVIHDLDFLKSEVSQQSNPLYEVLKTVKAVITTPSTTIIEAMLAGVPTVKIDYTNSPSFISTAWNITAKEHILSTLQELQNPSAQKLNFQESSCNWIIDNSFNYYEKLTTLISKMASFSQNSSKLPTNILKFDLQETIGKGYTVNDLFPKIDSFWINDINNLRIENHYLKIENARIRKTLKGLNFLVIIKNLIKNLIKN